MEMCLPGSSPVPEPLEEVESVCETVRVLLISSSFFSFPLPPFPKTWKADDESDHRAEDCGKGMDSTDPSQGAQLIF